MCKTVTKHTHPHVGHGAMIQARLFTEQQTETTSDDYYTPKWIFDTLGLHFDLDVASPPGGPPFVPCNRYFTQADDGLAQDWHGRIWMNPPYSNPTPWVNRFIEHGNGVALIPSSNGKWWLHLWQSDCVIVIAPPIKFLTGNGDTVGISVRTWLIAAGQDNIEALHNFGKVR